MNDNELREKIAILFGWTRKALAVNSLPIETSQHVLWFAPDGKECPPYAFPEIDGNTAMALLELVQRKQLEKTCRYPNEPYARTVSIRTSNHHAVMAFTAPHFLAEEVNARNVCEACVLALEAKQ